jgi:hypothetical protein
MSYQPRLAVRHPGHSRGGTSSAAPERARYLPEKNGTCDLNDVVIDGGEIRKRKKKPSGQFRDELGGQTWGVEYGTPESRRSCGRIDAPFRCAMPADSRPFVVARNERIEPKERRIERLPSGYSIREFYNHPQGRYWYVVTALEVMPTKRHRRKRI